jgi:hypothetical protein
MKTTALIFLSFFLVLSGPMKILKKGQKSESEFNFYIPSNENLNFSDQFLTNSFFSFLSNYAPLKENDGEAVGLFKESSNSLSKPSNLESAIYSEKEITIENWMTELSEFNKDAFNFVEDEIQIEEWMTNTTNFSIESTYSISIEKDMDIEEWMKDPDSWKEKASVPELIPDMEPDTNPSIEKWMTEPQVWVKVNNN